MNKKVRFPSLVKEIAREVALVIYHLALGLVVLNGDFGTFIIAILNLTLTYLREGKRKVLEILGTRKDRNRTFYMISLKEKVVVNSKTIIVLVSIASDLEAIAYPIKILAMIKNLLVFINKMLNTVI